MSSKADLKFGDPRGSVFDPLLFTLYTTPLSSMIFEHAIPHHLYADDNQLYVSFASGDSAVALNSLQSCLASVQSWMSTNKLKLNPDKTEFLLIGNERQRSKYLSMFPIELLSVKTNPAKYARLSIYLSIYLSLSRGDRWGTTRSSIQHSPFLSFLCSAHGVTQFQTSPIPDVIFPSISLSASPLPSLYSALGDGLGKSRSSCDIPIPLHFASFYSGQEFFIGSNGFPNPASYLFVGDVVFVRDAKETSESSHFHFLYLSLYFCC